MPQWDTEELFVHNFVNHNRGMMMRADFIGCATAASRRCMARHCSLVSCTGQVNWRTDDNSNIYNYLIEAEMYLVITIMAEYYQKSVITAQILPFIFHKNFLELILLLSWRFVMYHSDCLFNSSDFNMPESRGNAVNVKRKKNNIQKKWMNRLYVCTVASVSLVKTPLQESCT